MLFKITLAALLTVIPFSKVFAVETGAMVLGGFASILTHEAGHALTTHFLGGEVLAFRPYPTKVRYLEKDGTYKDKWTAGVVKSTRFEGENAASKNAAVAAMGSGGNLLSVLLLAPLLPALSSDFAKSSLDSMLFFSCFDAPAYIVTDMIIEESTNDWNRVSQLTGVALHWYLLGALASSLIVNEYRYHFHQKAFKQEPIRESRFAVGLSFPY